MMKRWLAIAVAGLLGWGAAQACGVGEMTAAGYENAPVEHAYQHWREGARSPIPFVFIDVRTPREYAQGHIPGARLIPLGELEQRIGEIPRDKRVYLYCRSGRRSAEAAAILARHGFSNIENVVGGIQAWQQAGYPLTRPEAQR